ncbi:hypothetical protein AAFF_G00376660 [Aldrovandia affinis]|uniref:Uncharacterized protein n=1 Tax=Aldrovandia affinis TaxID=143900 RepID=A0AAD7SFV5_9TELE|nr:hypothetical protein AAFF_G00376660 [Aldrovandia affinis]
MTVHSSVAGAVEGNNPSLAPHILPLTSEESAHAQPVMRPDPQRYDMNQREGVLTMMGINYPPPSFDPHTSPTGGWARPLWLGPAAVECGSREEYGASGTSCLTDKRTFGLAETRKVASRYVLRRVEVQYFTARLYPRRIEHGDGLRA